MIVDNSPYPKGRRICSRLHLGWNNDAVTFRFRQDVSRSIRKQFVSWLDSNSPIGRNSPKGLSELSVIFDVPVEKIGTGPAYFADTDPKVEGRGVTIDESNFDIYRTKCLDEDEIGFIQPCYAIVVNENVVSVCATVRRGNRSIEAGVDTEANYRGRGYASEVTAAWVAAARAEGMVPFYSTSCENIASQRVAEKVGLTQFAWELGIR